MKRIFLVCFVLAAVSMIAAKSDNFFDGNTPDDKKFPSLLPDKADAVAMDALIDSLYGKLDLANKGMQKQVFYNAYKGYEYLLSKNMLDNPNYLSICDYSQSSHNKRLYVIDLAAQTLLYNTYVSHGRNSGGEFATSFSNLTNSNKSSLGFLITAETYNGKNGYSLRFDGIEPGINDHVRNRDIVMHGSAYVNATRAEENGCMGRSFGCPAISYSEHKTIINQIKGGSCFYVYSADTWYSRNSRILNAKFSWPALAPAILLAKTDSLQVSVPAIVPPQAAP